MQNKMKKQILFMAIVYLAAIGNVIAQHEHSDHMKDDDHSADMMKSMDHKMEMIKSYDVDNQFQEQLQGLIKTNQNLVNAFSNDDEDAIKSAITDFSKSLTEVNMSLLSGDAHHDWMAYSMEISNATRQIKEADDIKFQRIQLAKLNDALYKSLKAFGTGGMDVYYDYCPMANNSVGANWLTTSSEIQNPYMGQQMPKCGSNKEILN